MPKYTVQLEQTIVGFADIDAPTISEERKTAEIAAYMLMQHATKDRMTVRVTEVLPDMYGKVE